MGGHQAMETASSVTRPQLFAILLLTVHGLAAGIIVAGLLGNFMA